MSTPSGNTPLDSPQSVSLRESCRIWLRVGLLSFGGPAAQIAVMHRLMVEEKRWVSEQRFLNALNCCMLLPGPEAQQLATFLGWTLHGIRGGLVAGLLFILPGSLCMLLLGFVYTEYRHIPALAGMLFGLQCAVLPILADAVLRMSRRVLQTRMLGLLAASGCIATLLIRVPFPAVVFTAGLAGWLWGRTNIAAKTSSELATALPQNTGPPHRWSVSLRVLVGGILLWCSPLLVAWRLQGTQSVYVQSGLLFSKAAVVTFGGAYAVLEYVKQQAVETYGWLDKAEMAAGLGLAETTPGPLILVVQFVGHVAGWRHGEGLPPAAAGVLGALLATWVTFVPSFIWIFLSAPWVDRLPRIRGATGALQWISAAVLGVIISLGLSLAKSTLISDEPLSADARLLEPTAIAITLLGAALTWYLRTGLGWVLLSCAGAGLVLRLLL
ncbi:MAG: chromate efflux transporter [Planctomycetota bacterium]